MERTPPGFLFNIKAFDLFTHHPVVVERLPAAVKQLLPDAIAEKSRAYLRDVPEEAEKLIWQKQAQALAPLAAAGKLGYVTLFIGQDAGEIGIKGPGRRGGVVYADEIRQIARSRILCSDKLGILPNAQVDS